MCPNIPGSPAGPPRATLHTQEGGRKMWVLSTKRYFHSTGPNVPSCTEISRIFDLQTPPLTSQNKKKKKADYCWDLHFEKLEAQQLWLASAQVEPCGISTHTDPKPQEPKAQRGLYLSWAQTHHCFLKSQVQQPSDIIFTRLRLVSN